ncbi:DUF899 family protein [Streptomyces sp. NPDC002588]|uniref:DUF899 family protein n=1 Tax=Streptomyces sp. NPDC002588 TaxID=3154419 RepID=UPI00331CA713
MWRHTRLTGESAEYLAAREELRLAEIDLMRLREKVAARRRSLPPGPPVDDYVFQEGPADLAAGDTPLREVSLGDLFTAPDRPLLIYHLMYGKRQTTPCPMCTLWIDGLDGIAHHLARTADFAVVAAADPPALRDHARTRGWHRVRLLSCGDSTFKYDLGSEDEVGDQDSAISVFTRSPDGTVHHTYSTHPRMSADLPERGIDLYTPLWNLLDLTPAGRGDWYPTLDYH